LHERAELTGRKKDEQHPVDAKSEYIAKSLTGEINPDEWDAI
jgi:hypothetical protein